MHEFVYSPTSEVRQSTRRNETVSNARTKPHIVAHEWRITQLRKLPAYVVGLWLVCLLMLCFQCCLDRTID